MLRKVKKSRRELFDLFDRPQATPLPERSYEYAEWRVAELGNTVEVGKGSDVRADPIGQLLSEGGFGIGVIRSAPHGDKKLSRYRLAGLRINETNPSP